MKKIYLLLLVAYCGVLMPGAFGQTTTFTFNGSVGVGQSGIGGSPQAYVVPLGVNLIGVDMYGGSGGWPCCSWSTSSSGGPVALGGRVQCTMNVTPGTTLYVYVGGAGGNNFNSATQSPGGWNGGGLGGQVGSAFCAGGGGESDIRTSTTGAYATSVLAVAGGGGGGGDFGPIGGAGGGTIGGSGSISVGFGSGPAPCGGGQTGPSCSTGSALGTQGQGGQSLLYSDGGGGAGWWGGNCGSNYNSGGGGSSYPATTNSVVSNIIHTQGYSVATGNGQVTITVLCSAPGTISGTQNVCLGSTTTLSDATGAAGGYWTTSDNTIASVGSSTGIVTGVNIGTATITYVVSNPCGALATATVTVNSLPTAITGPSTVCIGNTITVASTPSGGRWSTSNASVATVGTSTGIVSGAGSGTNSIGYTLPSGCSVSAALTVNPSPAGITGSTVVCPGNTITLSDATSGGTWSSSNTSLATVGATTGVVTGVSGGNPTITYTSANGCISTSVITVNSMGPITGVLGMCSLGTVSPLSDATPGGTWSSSNPAIASINPSSGVLTSVAYGTTTISYTVSSTGCTASAVAGITTTAGSAYTVTGSGSYCSGSTGLTISLSGSTSGVSYQLYNSSVPYGPAVTSVGFPFSFPTPATGGTYTVVADPGSSCSLAMTGSAIVTANALPTAYTMSGGGSYCTGSTGVHVYLNSSAIGINYQLYLSGVPVGSPVAGTSALIDFGLKTAAGTYSIIGTNVTTGCTGNMLNTVTVNAPNPLPTTSYTITGAGGYCSGSSTGVPIGLSNSVSGTNYQLYYGGIASGSPVAGSGTAISFPGSYTGAGTYSVVATITATGCSATMSTTATVTVNALPTVYTVTGGGSYCSGGAGLHIGLTGSATGVKYILYRGTTSAADTVAGTGAAPDFGAITTAGSYNVVAVNTTTGCTSNMFSSATIAINPLPGAFSISGGGAYCSGSAGVHVGLGGSVTGINYQLFNGGVLVSAAAGTGAPIDFGAMLSAGTYTVLATNPITTCTVNMTGSTSISINPLPTVFAVTGGGAYCSGSTGVHIGLSGSASGVNYQLYNGTVASGTAVAGTGVPLDFGLSTIAGSYTVIATNSATSCSSIMSSSAAVAINPLPLLFTVTGGGAYCAGGTGAHVGLSGSNSGFSYQLLNGAGIAGIPVLGGSGAIDFGLQTLTGTYTVSASNTITGCMDTMTTSVTVSTNPLPAAYTVSVSGSASYCASATATGVHVLLSNSASGFSYQLFGGGAPVGAPIAGSGVALDFGAHTAGTYTVVATNTTTRCTSNMTGSAVVSASPLPTAYLVTGGGSYCAGGTGVHIGMLSSVSGVSYQLLNGMAPAGSAVVGTGLAIDFGAKTAAGTYTVLATNMVTGCTNTMTGSATITINALPTAHRLTGGGSYCFGTPGSDIGLDGSETGNNYQLLLGGVASAAPVVGTGTALDFGLQMALGTYTILTTNTVTGCSALMTGSTAVGVNALPTLYTLTGGGNYCPGGTGVRIGLVNSDTGISYQLYNGTSSVGSPIRGTGIVLDFGLQTAAGTYTIIASNATTSCTVTMTGSAIIGLSALPAIYSISGGGQYCPGGTGVHIGLTGSNIGITYRLVNGVTPVGSSVSGSGLPLDFGLMTATGTYSIIATNSVTGCTSNMRGTVAVSISTLPPVHIVTGGGSNCTGAAGVHIGLDASDTGIIYQLYNGTTPVGTPVTGTGSSLDFGLRTLAGTYTVVARNRITSCTNNMIGSAAVVTIPLPTSYPIAGGGNYCSGTAGVHVMLNGSGVGVNYQLFNGALPTGAPLPGTGAILDFGLETATGAYTVVATDATTGCVANMAGSVVVGINTLPIAYTVSGGGNYCVGGAGVHVTLSGSNTGVSYQLLNGGIPVGLAIAGTGGRLDFGLQTARGTFSVVATNGSTSCTSSMTGSVDISTSALPDVYSVSSTSSNYCLGGSGVDIALTGSQAGVNYQLYRGTAPVGSPVAGTGSALDFGLNTLSGMYTVTATNAGSSCTINMASSVTVVINPLPVAYTITGAGNYCVGGVGVNIGLSNSNTGIYYQLYNGITAVGGAVPGTGSAISFGLQAATGSYSVVALNPATTCTNNMSGSPVVSVSSLPTPYAVTGGGNYCAGGAGVHIGVSNSTSGVNYQAYLGTAPVGPVVSGTGTTLDLGAETAGGSYTVVATNIATGCTNNMVGAASVVISRPPAAYSVTGGGNYCAGGTGVHIGLSGSATGVSYQLYNGISPVGAPLGSIGSLLDFGLQTVAGTYSVVATDASTSCTSNMSGIANVVINPLPQAFAVTGGGNFCAGGPGAEVSLNGSAVGITYQLYGGVSPVGSPVAGTGRVLDMGAATEAGSYTVTAVNAITSCTRNMTGSTIVTESPVVTPVVTVTPPSSDTLCGGNFTNFIATAINGGSAPSYSWVVNGVPVSASGSNYGYIPSNGDVVTVTLTSNATCATSPIATASVPVHVIDKGYPSVAVASAPGNIVCQGTPVTFTASPSLGGPAPSFAWLKNAVNVGSGSTFTYTPQNGDIVYCVLTSDYRCRLANTGSSTPVTMEVDMMLTPGVTITHSPAGSIAPGEAVTFAAIVSNGGSAPSFQWLINGIPVSGATGSTFVTSDLTNMDSVSCQVLSGGGCSGIQGSGSVTVAISGVSVKTIQTAGSVITVAPNPNKGAFTVKGSFSTSADQEVTLEVTDMIGQVVYSNKIVVRNGSLNEKIQLTDIANGIYLLNLRTESENKVFHIAIEQ